MGAIEVCRQPDAGYAEFDFYDGLAALLRIADEISRQTHSPLNNWLPRGQGYLNVALKHLPEIGRVDYTQRDLAWQWRAANLLQSAVLISARWLQRELLVESGVLAAHPAFYVVRAMLPEEAVVVLYFAQRRAGDGGLFWD